MHWWIVALLFEHPVGHPAELGLGSVVALPASPAVVFRNPAALEHRSYTAFFSLPYGGLGIFLHHLGLAYVYPVREGLRAGVFVEQVGANLEGTYTGRYAELTAGVNAAYPVARELRVGLALKVLRYQDPRSGAFHAPGVDVGFLFLPQRFWSVGAVLANANRPKVGTETVSPAVEAAVALFPYEGATTTAGVRQVEGEALRWMVGQEVHLNAYPVAFRFSLQRESDAYVAFAVGGEFSFTGMKVDYTAFFRPGLPLSHSFALNRVW